jgi:hypothetical protein
MDHTSDYMLLFAGSAACSQLSTLRKLTSLVAGECATHCLLAMLPALRALRRLKCIVNWFHTDGSGALPVLSELTALEDLHMTGRLVGDYKLAFPPSLKVPTLECLGFAAMVMPCNGIKHIYTGMQLPVVAAMFVCV